MTTFRAIGLGVSVLVYGLYLGAIAAKAQTPPAEPPRERIEWCDVWHTDADKHDRPRVLFIGDSITQGYFGEVEQLLGDKAYCSRYTTSRSIGDPVYFQELELVLSQYKYSIIHFNHGLHGWGYTEAQYAEAFDKLLHMLQAEGKGARLIWAATTPIVPNSAGEDQTARIIARNAIAAERIEKQKIPTTDLFALSVDHPEHHVPDGVHFTGDAKKIQAAAVAESVEKALSK